MSNPNETLYNKLKGNKSSLVILNALVVYHRENDKEFSKYVKEKNIDISCKTKCNYCCYLPVSVHPYEVFLINWYMNSKFSKGKKEQTVVSLEKYNQTIAKLSKHARVVQNIPCPMLVDGACVIYKARPFSCRNYYSLDVASCERSFNNPDDLEETRPFNEDLTINLQASREMVSRIFYEFGYDTSPHELCTALLARIQSPTSQKRWVKKKKAFVDIGTYSND